MRIRIRHGAAIALATVGCHTAAPLSPPACRSFGPDYGVFWQRIRDDYAYLGRKAVDWSKAGAIYRARAETASTRRVFLTILERSIDELYDAHVSVRSNTAASPRLVPSGLDLWAEWRDDHALVTQLRPGFPAERAGIVVGDVITAINGKPVRQAAMARLGVALIRPDSAAFQWALLSALAGRHDTPRTFSVADSSGHERTIVVDEDDAHGLDNPPPLPPIEWKILDAAIGYIRINDLIDTQTVRAFDEALDSLRRTRSLVLDLRNTPLGGSTAVAEPIMGRFVSRTSPYQVVAPTHGPAFVRTVAPRGPWTYDRPLAVLVSRWTGSMGEGMAIGFDGMHRAIVVGSRMAGLAGAVEEMRLPCSGLVVGYPAARLLHLDGTPREAFVPPVLVPPSTRDADAALAEASRLLRSSAP